MRRKIQVSRQKTRFCFDKQHKKQKGKNCRGRIFSSHLLAIHGMQVIMSSLPKARLKKLAEPCSPVVKLVKHF